MVIMEDFTEISKERLGVQARCRRVGILKGSPEKVMHETENEAKVGKETPGIKRCQYHEHLLKKGADCRKSQTKRAAIWALTTKESLQKPLEITFHCHVPQVLEVEL